MAAFYHILAPFEISIEDNPDLENELFSTFGDDFTLKSTKRIERFSPLLPDGQRLDWSYQEKTFALPDEIVRKEFSSFALVLFEEWRNLYKSKFKGKFPASLVKAEDLELQVSQSNALLSQYPLASDQLEKKLQDLEDNYFFTIEDIAPQVVYQGYPLETRKHTSLRALNFLHSYEKMGVYPDEYAAMFLLVDLLKEKYSKQFVLAKYLFIAGY